MVVYPCDIHKVSRLLTGKKGQLRKEVPSVAMMTDFGFGPLVMHTRLCYAYYLCMYAFVEPHCVALSVRVRITIVADN